MWGETASGLQDRPSSMDDLRFPYTPKCSTPGCDQHALYKVAALWSDGTSRELKNYGLACALPRDSQLMRGRLHREGLTLAEGESVGPVGLYRLEFGRRDADLPRLPDHET